MCYIDQYKHESLDISVYVTEIVRLETQVNILAYPPEVQDLFCGEVMAVGEKYQCEGHVFDLTEDLSGKMELLHVDNYKIIEFNLPGNKTSDNDSFF